MKGIVKRSSAPGATLESHLLDPRSGEGEIVGKVESAAICGTDLHDLGQIIAAKYPFEEFQSAFEAAIGGILGKVILVP